MEQKRLICPIHRNLKNPLLDLVCTNQLCSHKGAFCHHCLKEGFHSEHMADDNLAIDNFISKSLEDLESVKTKTEEKYKKLQREIEDVSKTMTNTIKSMNKRLNASVGELMNNITDLKTNVEKIIDNDPHNFQLEIHNLLAKSGKFSFNDQLSQDFDKIERDINRWKIILENFSENNVTKVEFELIGKDKKVSSQIELNSEKLKKSALQKLNQIMNQNNEDSLLIRTQDFEFEPLLQNNRGNTEVKDKLVENFKEGELKKNLQKPNIDMILQKKIKQDNKKIQEDGNDDKEILRDLIRLNDSLEVQEFNFLDIHAITFESRKSIALHGFAHYLLKDMNVKATFDYLLLEGETVDEIKPTILSQGQIMLGFSSQKRMEKIFFNPFAVLIPNKKYTLKIVNKTREAFNKFKCYRGTNGKEDYTDFRFYLSKNLSKKTQLFTSIESGQIPRFYYKYF